MSQSLSNLTSSLQPLPPLHPPHSPPFSNPRPKMSTGSADSQAQLAASYAALILADEGVEITAEKLQNLIKKADIKVESVVPNLFAKVLEGKDAKKTVEELNEEGNTSGELNSEACEYI